MPFLPQDVLRPCQVAAVDQAGRLKRKRLYSNDSFIGYYLYYLYYLCMPLLHFEVARLLKDLYKHYRHAICFSLFLGSTC